MSAPCSTVSRIADIAIISAEAFDMANPELMDRMIRTHLLNSSSSDY